MNYIDRVLDSVEGKVNNCQLRFMTKLTISLPSYCLVIMDVHDLHRKSLLVCSWVLNEILITCLSNAVEVVNFLSCKIAN